MVTVRSEKLYRIRTLFGFGCATAEKAPRLSRKTAAVMSTACARNSRRLSRPSEYCDSIWMFAIRFFGLANDHLLNYCYISGMLTQPNRNTCIVVLRQHEKTHEIHGGGCNLPTHCLGLLIVAPESATWY